MDRKRRWRRQRSWLVTSQYLSYARVSGQFADCDWLKVQLMWLRFCYLLQEYTPLGCTAWPYSVLFQLTHVTCGYKSWILRADGEGMGLGVPTPAAEVIAGSRLFVDKASSVGGIAHPVLSQENFHHSSGLTLHESKFPLFHCLKYWACYAAQKNSLRVFASLANYHLLNWVVVNSLVFYLV